MALKTVQLWGTEVELMNANPKVIAQISYVIKCNKNIVKKEKRMKKLVSVIIPCFNAEKYIAECLDSLINQTIGIDNLEIIVIDDASTDNSINVVERYQKVYPESITHICLPKNCGQAHARNIGIDQANGEYLTFVDADDWVSLDIYKKLLEPLETYQYDMVHCSYREYIEGIAPNDVIQGNNESIIINRDEDRIRFLSEFYMGGVIGCCIYKTSFLRNGKIKFKQFEKYEDNYFGKIVKYNLTSFCSIKDILYHYRILKNSNSHSQNDLGHFARLNVELELLKLFQENGMYNKYYEFIRNDFFNAFYINTLHICCCQFDEFPLEQVKLMQSIVKELFPDYLDYCRTSSKFINPLLTVPFDFPIEVWNDYRDAYKTWCLYDEEEAITNIYLSLREALGIK